MLSASTAAVTTWMGPLGKKNDKILYSKSQSQSVDTEEGIAWYHNSLVCPVLPSTQQLALLDRLLGYTNVSCDQCCHSVSEVIKMMTHNKKAIKFD